MKNESFVNWGGSSKSYMKLLRIFFGFLVIVCISILASCASKESSEFDNAAELFVFEILPVLQSKCFSCHGENPNELEGGFDLRTWESVARGGEQYPEVILSGRPEFSPLYLALTREDEEFAMPPKERDALSDVEVQAFYSWIVSGAPWPDKEEQKLIMASAGDRKRSSLQMPELGGESAQWNERYYRSSDLWAYSPIDSIDIPSGFDGRNPIDAFLEEKMSRSGIRPAPKADRKTLVKRIYYDLIGLPPTIPQVQSYLDDKSELANSDLIENLLASEQYGEQWARHWLDVTRYSDSDGFSNDFSRPNAWRYRDYVIRSFNRDLPYDQFIRQQIAGDEFDPSDPESLIATAFLRMGPWEHTGMSVAVETRQFFLDDVTNSVGETFLATPLNCAKCHDHKYDPIPTKDYYSIQAVFATTQLAEREAPFLQSEGDVIAHPEKSLIEDWLQKARDGIQYFNTLEEDNAKQWFRDRKRTYVSKKARRMLNEKDQPPRYYGLSDEELGVRKVMQKRTQFLTQDLERFKPLAYSVYNGPTRTVYSSRPMRVPDVTEGEPQATFVLKGGSVYSAGIPVDPGVLTVVHHIDSGLPVDFQNLESLPTTMDGRRSAFAEWLAHPANPLTARVMVNRIWQHHFGHGLAENSNNFGASGRKPSHPELLDWLALKFVSDGWSIKELHKLIMTSDAYLRSGVHSDFENIMQLDPQNRLLSFYPSRRLDAEELRDALLLLSGSLNRVIGGIPIRPQIPLEVALQPRHSMGSLAPSYQPSLTPADRNRRSIYIERRRSLENPMMQTFDQSNSNISCERRESSTVVTQAFDLLNNPQIRTSSLALASRVVESSIVLKEQIAQVHEAILYRPPSKAELSEGVEYLNNSLNYHRVNDAIKSEFPKSVEHEMFEEMTGSAFHYNEELEVYNVFMPDLQDADVSVEVRALADYVGILFSTNEFIYVY